MARTPRQDELCKIIAEDFGGRAPSKSAAYLRLQYRGGPSNMYGSFVMERARRSGLVREAGRIGNRIAVELTEAGRARARAANL